MSVRPPLVRLYDDEACIDGFAGGGGTSTGIEHALGKPPDVAINHDRHALAMHLKNHPETRHVRSNIRTVNYRTVLGGKKCGFAWFSPDCTYFSKALGGKPFRDRNRARRIRGLAWEAVRCAEAIHPRILFLENVEEFLDWGPIGMNGRPDPAKRGASFRRWKMRLERLGYVVEVRKIRASEYGAPTSRQRLFIIARCDGRPICWPIPTHGPQTAHRPRAAAEKIDFTLPVPSIFLTPSAAKAWGRAYGVPAPRRPLALATMRRIARGIKRFVLEAADPFIIPVTHQGDYRVHSIREPLRTITSAQRGEFALVAPLLINTRNGERQGQLPRVYDIRAPYATITAQGSQGALVAAFLAKHNGGHEATGQRIDQSIHAITTRDQKALVTSHLVKLRGGLEDHVHTAQDLRDPIPTLTAGGTHLAEIRAFLVKFYGTKKDGCQIGLPLDTVTTKARFGLVTVTIAGEDYVLVDIGMRMLTPRELFGCQGFPDDYIIEEGIDPETGTPIRFTKQTQIRLVGNSVPPHVSAALITANLASRKAGVA